MVTPHNTYTPTKNQGDYNFYSEDTISSYLKENVIGTKAVSEDCLRQFGYLLAEEVVNNTDGVYFEGIGTLRVSGNARKTIDHRSSKLAQKKVYLRNVQTGGLVFRAHFLLIPSRWSGVRYFKSSYSLRMSLKERIKKGYMHFLVFQNLKSVNNPHR